MMLREPVRRDRIVTILPSGKAGRELVKNRAPYGQANCVIVRHTAVVLSVESTCCSAQFIFFTQVDDGSRGLHLRAIATMAPGTQLTITCDACAQSILYGRVTLKHRFDEPPAEAEADEKPADAMVVDDAPLALEGHAGADITLDDGAAAMMADAPSFDDGARFQPMSDADNLDDGAAPMMAEAPSSEYDARFQPMSDADDLDDGAAPMMAEAPPADGGARLQALFDALDDDDARLASSDAEDLLPARRRVAL